METPDKHGKSYLFEGKSGRVAELQLDMVWANGSKQGAWPGSHVYLL